MGLQAEDEVGNSLKGQSVPGTCVIGLQWGDEAKGKVVDLLTSKYQIVVRYLGGANAGHTVVVGDQTYKLHHIPSGILNPKAINVITAGVVINPATLLAEVDMLTERGVTVGENLLLSDRAHVVCPWHIAEDRLMDKRVVGGENIGTTLRGIGPCYRDKVGRALAVRLGDLYRERFRERIEEIVTAKKQWLSGLNGQSGEVERELDPARIYDEFMGYANRLRQHLADTTRFLLDSVDADKRLLFEGAQGTLLDVDHGTYPFVTSSNSSGVGVSSGAGVPPQAITKVIGVAKGYTTRVGGGPFPTEQDDEVGERIRKLGNEFGTTTGRPRRCGWFDAVAVRYAARLSGVDAVALMMMDVISQLPEIKICTAYDLDGERIDYFPGHASDLRRVKPVYETLPGWETDVTGIRKLADLPTGARRYLERISELVGRPIDAISVGPARDQMIFAAEL